MYRNKNTLKLILFLTSIYLAFLLLGQDFKVFISWWTCLLVIGIVFLPLSFKIFQRFSDRGYLFSKVIGIAISSYFMWLLSSLKLLEFKAFQGVIIVVFMAGLNYIILLKYDLKVLIKKKIDIYFTMEIMFFLILLFFVFIRGFKPEAYGTEKFMDYGFMSSMMRSDYMPPQDFWFAGEQLNYYYVGQYIATFLTKVSFVPVTHGYNLMLMTIAAFSFVLPYSLIYNVTNNYYINKKTKAKYGPHIAGILSATAVSMAGNMHFTIFYFIIPSLQDMLKVERSSYWFSNSTRYIGYHPETTDKTIHEYPSYSFILGDLHAHVINIIFVLTIIGILYAWLLDSRKLSISKYLDIKASDFIKDAISLRVIFIGFLIGLFHMTNFWDFPIYFVVTGGIILFSLIRNYGFSKITFLLTSINGILVIFIAELTSILFTLSFNQISTNIVKTTSHTPLYQLLILWGLPIALIIGFTRELVQTYLVIKEVRKRNTDWENENKKLYNFSSVSGKIKVFFNTEIVNFLRSILLSDLFILVLGLCGIGLVLIPELIYVEDIYKGDFKRANTMFKLTYQAFIMFGISSGYIIVKFFKSQRFLWQKKFAIICSALLVSTFIYFPVAIDDWYGDISQIENYKGLDATAFLKDSMPADYPAISWINDNVPDKSVILEANGDSYTDYQRVSVFTGQPTVLGWYVHEWLWRGDTDIVNERAVDIKSIYTSANIEEVIKLINKYSIEYIYVGKLEQEKYNDINHELLRSLGEVVYYNPDYMNTLDDTYIVNIY